MDVLKLVKFFPRSISVKSGRPGENYEVFWVNVKSGSWGSFLDYQSGVDDQRCDTAHKE